MTSSIGAGVVVEVVVVVVVVVGTGVVSNSDRDSFKRKATPTVEEQIRDRPKWAMIAAAAVASKQGDAAQPTEQAQAHPKVQRELKALGVLAPPGCPPWKRWYDCSACLNAGSTFVGVEPQRLPESGVEVRACATCRMELCDVQCNRRGPCPNHLPWGGWHVQDHALMWST